MPQGEPDARMMRTVRAHGEPPLAKERHAGAPPRKTGKVQCIAGVAAGRNPGMVPGPGRPLTDSWRGVRVVEGARLEIW